MSGLAGCFCFAENYITDFDRAINYMLAPLATTHNHQIQFYADSGSCALGICNSSDVDTAKLWHHDESAFAIAFNGHLTNIDDLIALTGISEAQNNSSEPKIILSLFEKFNDEITGYLKGNYAFAIWDRSQKKLTIGTDRYGFEFVYYHADENLFLFSSEIRPILNVLKEKPEADIDSICDIHNFNAIFGTKTPFKEIHLIPHAAICRPGKDGINVKQYWDYPMEVEHSEDSEDKLMQRSKELIRNAARNSVKNTKNFGIMLSGGLDSRLLAAVLKEISEDFIAFSFQWGGLNKHENRIAKQIASELDIRLLYFPRPQINTIDFINDYSILSGGQWAFYDLLPAIQKICSEYPGITLVNGFLMDTLFKSGWAFFPSNDQHKLTTEQVVKRYSVLGDYMADLVFKSEFKELIKQKKREAVHLEIDAFPDDKPAEVSLRFYCVNRGRRAILSHYKVLQHYVKMVFPGTCYDLVDFAFKLPYKIRSSTEFYRKIIYSWFPGVGAIPWDRTGKALQKGVSQRAKKIEDVLLKAKYALQRASRGRIDLLNSPVSFNRRFRIDKTFRDSIMNILYDRKTLNRGFFDLNGIDALVKRQLSGRDHAGLFKSILSVEMLYRNFIDA